MPSVVFYTLGFGFIGGIAVGSLIHIDRYILFWVSVIGGVMVLLWRQKSFGFLSPLALASMFLFSSAFGMFHVQHTLKQSSMLSAYVGLRVDFEGVVKREPDIRDTSVHLTIAPKGYEDRGSSKVLVTVSRATYDQTISFGDVVRVRGMVTYPTSFETDTGRAFNYPMYLRARDIDTLMQYAEVTVVQEGQRSVPRVLYVYKKKFIEHIETALPMPHAGLAEGLLLGVKRALGDELEEAFRRTGIIHIVVLSGYNILIVVEALMILLMYICRPRTRMFVGLLGIALFGILVGLSATVLRACIMASLLVIARGTGRTYAIMRALMLACVIMLLINPLLLLYDVGFQLSFLATLGLVLFAPHVEKHLTYIPQALGLRSIVSATIATQIAVTPLLLFQTGTLSLIAVLVNAVVLPVVPVTMFMIFCTGVVGMVISPLSAVFGSIAYGLLTYIIRVAEWFSALPFAAHTIEVFPVWIVVCMYSGIGIWYVLYARERAYTHSVQPKIKNAYAGWVIEEVSNDSQSSIKHKRSHADTLPFRQ